jgi:hypothetical protein
VRVSKDAPRLCKRSDKTAAGILQSIQVELAVVDAKTGEKLAVYPEIT